MHETLKLLTVFLLSALSTLFAAGQEPTDVAGRRTIVTVSASTPELPRKSEGDVIELTDGRLLLVSMEFGGDGSDFATTRFVSHESSDGGRAWGRHRVITETRKGDLNVYSPNLIRAKDGGILLLFMRQHRPGSLTNHVWKSTDEGQTFSPLAEFVAKRDLALCNATVKRLDSGRLLLPASPPAPGKPAETGPYAATMLYSDNDGLTWQVSESRIELPMRGAMEPHVEQTADGRVLMVMRNQLGKLYLSESKDDGATWSPPFASSLTAPESCPELTRIPGTSDLLMIWNNSYDPKFRSHFGKRSPLTAAVSKDHGRTWQHVRDIETDATRAFSNPGCRFTRDGRAIINYWTCEYLPNWAMQDVIDLRVAVIDKSWFYGEPARLPLVGYTEHRTNLPGGRHANVRTNRAMVVEADGTERRAVGAELVNEANVWTQFAGWSPDGGTAVVLRGWESVENAQWEEEHKTFRFTPEGWLVDSYLVEMATGKAENVTGVERVSFYNSGLFFWPNDPTKLGFTALIGGNSKPFRMDRDGRNKTDLTQMSSGFAYGFSGSPDGSRISYHENYQVYLADADGSNRIHVRTGHPFVFAPSWSPDGKWLLFVSGEHYNCHPHIVQADGTGLKKIADRGGYRGVTEFLDVPDYHGGSSDIPVWSVDGQSVFYTAKVGNNVELFRVALDGRTERLTHSADGTSHYHPKPSPDGQWIVYGSKRNGARNLFVMRLSDRSEHALTDVPAGHAAMHAYWQPLSIQAVAPQHPENAR